MDALFPRKCLVCRASIKTGVICEKCRAEITPNTSFFCGKCKARICGTRKTCHKDFPYLLGGAASYGDKTIKTLIHCLKFRGMRDAAEPLAEIMGKYISGLDADLAGYSIIPIPLSPKRQRERGFNQAELIGKILAARLNIPLETKILVRIKHASPQSATENAIERRMNVRGCFAAASGSLCGRKVILVDDVTTSGATFLEAALSIKNAGAKKIIALAAAMA